MTTQARAKSPEANSAFVHVQRKCRCGAPSREGGTCSNCKTGSETIESSMGKPLEQSTQASMHTSFDSDFSAVRIHDDSRSHEAARGLEARAFTLGQDIYFGAGEYDVSSRKGSMLVAHELAHTIQQRGSTERTVTSGMVVADVANPALEVEADRAAEAVATGRAARVNLSAGIQAPLRQKGGSTQAPPKIVQPVNPNNKQQKAIDDARRAAAIRTQTAGFKARGIQGDQDFMEARHLAQIKFDWTDPNMDQVGEILGKMGGGLPTVSVQVAGQGDPDCGNRAGYVRGHRAPIVLCPAFFSSSPEERVRTMIHEMAHVVGIGSAQVGEQYFMVFDCDSKGDFSSADSWANYVHCLSGQTPDKPLSIKGTAGGGSSKPPPNAGKKP